MKWLWHCQIFSVPHPCLQEVRIQAYAEMQAWKENKINCIRERNLRHWMKGIKQEALKCSNSAQVNEKYDLKVERREADTPTKHIPPTFLYFPLGYKDKNTVVIEKICFLSSQSDLLFVSAVPPSTELSTPNSHSFVNKVSFDSSHIKQSRYVLRTGQIFEFVPTSFVYFLFCWTCLGITSSTCTEQLWAQQTVLKM